MEEVIFGTDGMGGNENLISSFYMGKGLVGLF